MDIFTSEVILEKPKEEVKEVKEKKQINFQEMPKGTEDILNHNSQAQQQAIIDKFTKDEPVAMPFENNANASHLSLILSPNLRELEMMIRGLEYIKRFNPLIGKDEVILRKIEGHPLNDYGINKILELLRVWSSSELKLGRRTPKDAIASAMQIGNDARRLIYKNLRNFGMETQVAQRNAKTYVLIIFEFAYSSLTRSIAGMENDSSRPTEFSIQSNMNEMNNPINQLNKQQKDNLKN